MVKSLELQLGILSEFAKEQHLVTGKESKSEKLLDLQTGSQLEQPLVLLLEIQSEKTMVKMMVQTTEPP